MTGLETFEQVLTLSGMQRWCCSGGQREIGFGRCQCGRVAVLTDAVQNEVKVVRRVHDLAGTPLHRYAITFQQRVEFSYGVGMQIAQGQSQSDCPPVLISAGENVGALFGGEMDKQCGERSDRIGMAALQRPLQSRHAIGSARGQQPGPLFSRYGVKLFAKGAHGVGIACAQGDVQCGDAVSPWSFGRLETLRVHAVRQRARRIVCIPPCDGITRIARLCG